MNDQMLTKDADLDHIFDKITLVGDSLFDQKKKDTTYEDDC